ncbi:MAG: hypothetical protein BIFFINMI_02445 [Phycisphaerae bacterium]|nr:hypothetical protein [Phycisphaerae bacterium]
MASPAKVLRWTFILLLSAGIVVLAALTWRLMRRQTPPPRPATLPAVALDTLASPPARPTTTTAPDADAREIVHLLEGMAGGPQTDPGAPSGLPLPAGARRLGGEFQNLPGGRQERGRYLVNETPDVLESFYRKAMADAGWRPMPIRGGDSLSFIKGAQTCMILLAATGQGTQVTVVLQTRQ